MIQRQTNPILPQYGEANQPQIALALNPLADAITEVAFARRGRLYLLCEQTQDESVPGSLYQRFYFSANYDPMRSLQQALRQTFSTVSSSTPVAGALVHNMTLYAVGSVQTYVWLWRRRQLIQVLPNPKGTAVNAPEKNGAPVTSPQPFHDAQRRLYPGDTIILSSSLAGRRISAKLVRQAEAFTTAPESLARAIAQFTKSSTEPHPPVTVIRLPGTAVTPNLSPQSQMDFSYADASDIAPQAKVPPILLAAIIALIAIVLAVIVTKPKLPTNFLKDFLMRTPKATITIRTATPGTILTSPTSSAAP